MVKRKIHLVKLKNWCMFLLAILVYQRASFLISCLISGSRFDKPRRLNLFVWDCGMMNHGTVSKQVPSHIVLFELSCSCSCSKHQKLVMGVWHNQKPTTAVGFQSQRSYEGAPSKQ